MRTISILTQALLVAFLCLQCSQSTTDTAPKPSERNPSADAIENLSAAETSLLNSSNQFGFKLFREIMDTEAANENVFISPLSASYALALCYNGAGGVTRDEIATTLELAGLTPEEVNEAYLNLATILTSLDPKVKVSLANSIWYREEMTAKPAFVDISRTYFDALVRGLDFAEPSAADTINAWVFDKTRGRIEDIVKKPISRDAVAFLLNAIYFKGTWTVSFDSADTQEGKFTRVDGVVTHPDMMSSDTTMLYFSNDLFEACDLSYGDERFSMTILLPKSGKTTDDILGVLTYENWDDWMNQFALKNMPLLMPKFKLAYEVKLNDMLKALGMVTAFDAADFGNMFEGGDGFAISEVKQKSFVQVDERGTEAAAVTVVEIIRTVSEPEMMLVNRPFIFALRERTTGTVLFIGRIADPIWE